MSEIQTDKQYQDAVQDINTIDTFVSKLYNEIVKYTSESDILSIQEWIDRLMDKRLGLYNLCAIFANRKKQDNKQYDIYTCRYKDTLIKIAQAYYGNADFWQYLYVINNLEDAILIPFQQINVPLINPSKTKVYNGELIAFMDDYELGLI